jgi:hypothetical protein
MAFVPRHLTSDTAGLVTSFRDGLKKCRKPFHLVPVSHLLQLPSFRPRACDKGIYDRKRILIGLNRKLFETYLTCRSVAQ